MSASPRIPGGVVHVAVAGAAGRMGRLLVAGVAADAGLTLAGATELAGSPHVGADAGELAGCGRLGVSLVADLGEALARARVLIDFTAPAATLPALEAAAQRGAAAVVGTTGWSASERTRLEAIAARLPVVFAPNFAAGVQVLTRLVEQAVALLGPGFDVEVLELHHRRKEDAPSGTALHLAAAAARARGVALDDVRRTAREGRPGPRSDGEIGLQALRGGDVPGDHTVFLLGAGERLELTHRAGSREAFVAGALRAALWVADRPPGLYTMADVLAP